MNVTDGMVVQLLLRWAADLAGAWDALDVVRAGLEGDTQDDAARELENVARVRREIKEAAFLGSTGK